jgi:carboxyl-terminal processing protease
VKLIQNRISEIFLVLLAFSIVFGCKKERQSDRLTGSNGWILDSMRVYYYWKDQLPVNPPDQANASSFFKSLLYSADRFSFLDNPDEDRKEYSSFAWYGFEYALLEREDHPGELMGIITLVVPDGPADRKGLVRGDVFTAVNGIALQQANIDQVTKILKLGSGVQLSLATTVAGELVPGKSIDVQYARHNELPVYLTKVFDVHGKKTGYIFYNQFSGSYDYQILESLNRLGNEGITDLVIDLRYNPGGDVSTSAKIAGILSNATADQTFVIYQGNNKAGRRISSFQKTMRENAFEPQLFSELLNYRLSLSRVMVLTSGSTASAAELLINNLRPYTRVIQIGSKTMGKDMASFAIADLRSPKLVNMVLHPLIFKLFNAQNAGNYETGLKPDYEVDEFSDLPLKAFGDPKDPLLKKALEISGSQPVAAALLKRLHMGSGNLKYHSATIRNREHAILEISK